MPPVATQAFNPGNVTSTDRCKSAIYSITTNADLLQSIGVYPSRTPALRSVVVQLPSTFVIRYGSASHMAPIVANELHRTPSHTPAHVRTVLPPMSLLSKALSRSSSASKHTSSVLLLPPTMPWLSKHAKTTSNVVPEMLLLRLSKLLPRARCHPARRLPPQAEQVVQQALLLSLRLPLRRLVPPLPTPSIWLLVLLLPCSWLP
jgi:hypothetical protein